MDFQAILHWATSTDWGTGVILILAAIGALDAFLWALLQVSNFFFPSVKWDDNAFAVIHGLLGKAIGLLGKIVKKKV